MQTHSLEHLRAELARQQVEFERAADVLATAGDNAFVASERVDELHALLDSAPSPSLSNQFIRV